MEATRSKDIRKALESAGFSVYFPGQHKGECTDPYIVVKDSGTVQLSTFSSIQYLYDILLYVPVNQFSKIDPLMQTIKKTMKELSKKIALLPTYDMTDPYFDDSVQGYMTSISYANIRRQI